MALSESTFDLQMRELDEAIRKLDDMDKMEMNSHQRHSLQAILQQAYQFWAYIESEKQRFNIERNAHKRTLVMSMTPVIKALNTISDKNISLTTQWEIIRKIRYQTTVSEKILFYAKKIIRTLCMAAAGFIMGAAMGASVTGGIASLPAAIITSIKAAAAIWGNAGALNAAVSPLFFACMLGHKEAIKKTTPVLEQEINKTRRVLANKNRYDLTLHIEKNLDELKKISSKRNAYHMLSKIYARAKKLGAAPTHWYTVNRLAAHKKSIHLYHATDQVLHLLLTKYHDSQPSNSDILQLPICIESQTMPYASVLNTQRHPWLDCLFSPSRKKNTRTFQEASQEYHTACL